MSNQHSKTTKLGNERDRKRRQSVSAQSAPPPIFKPPAKLRRNITVQPLAPMRYVFISGIGLVFTIGMLWLYVSQAPLLVQSDIEGRFYYILVSFFALSLAIFVFGAMRGYASYSGNQLSGKLKVSGAFVVMAFTVIGGFYLTKPADSFSVTVRLFDQNGKPISHGIVSLRLGQDTRSGQSTSLGEVDFKEIHRKFQNTKLDLDVDVKGYQLTSVTPENLSAVVQVKLRQIEGEITGTGRADTFAVTARPFGPNNEAISSGEVTLYLGSDTRKVPIAQNGEANFKEIPLKFYGVVVRVRVDAKGYSMPKLQTIRLDDTINIYLTRIKQRPTSSVTIKPLNSPYSQHLPEGMETQQTAPEPSRGSSINESCTAECIRLRRC